MIIIMMKINIDVNNENMKINKIIDVVKFKV